MAVSISEGWGLFQQVLNYIKISWVYYGIVEQRKNDSENSFLIEIINREKSATTDVIIEIASNTKITGEPDFKKDKSVFKKEYSEDKLLLVTAGLLF